MLFYILKYYVYIHKQCTLLKKMGILPEGSYDGPCLLKMFSSSSTNKQADKET